LNEECGEVEALRSVERAPRKTRRFLMVVGVMTEGEEKERDAKSDGRL